MSSSSLSNHKSPLYYLAWIAGGLALLLALGFGALALLVLSKLGAGAQLAGFAAWLFAADTQQVTWYITRAAGLTAYLLLWLSTAWGLAVPSRILDGALHGSFTFDFHQFISLLSLGFLGVHVAVLLADQYAPFSLAQVLFPFISDYRPAWTGLGVIALWLAVLVTVTFYLKSRIGMKAFRAIHISSLAGYLLGAAHGFGAGTDTPLPAVQAMYLVTFLSVVFLTTYWLIGRASKKPKPIPAKAR